MKLGQHDVYLNVAGGLRITEPAADLAAAAALISSLSGDALPPDTVYFGELGLSGAIRPVAQEQARLKEAAKLGFSSAISPQPRLDKSKGSKSERLPPLPPPSATSPTSSRISRSGDEKHPRSASWSHC